MHRPMWWSRNLGWLLTTRGLRSFAQAIMVVAVPLELAKLGVSTTRVGTLLTLGALGSAAMVLVVGIFADRFGRKPMLLVVASLGAGGAAGFVFSQNYWVLAAMAALSSMGKGGGAGSAGGYGAFYPAEQPLIADCAPRAGDRNTVFASVSIVALTASIAGSLVVFSVGGHTNLDRLHLLLIVAFVASIGTAASVAPIKEKHHDPEPDESAVSARNALPLVARLWVTGGLNGLALGVLGPFLAYWLHIRFGLGARDIGTLFLLGNIAMALTTFAAPALGRALGAVRATSWTRFASVISLIGLALAPTFVLAATAFIVRTVLNGVGGPIRQSFVMGMSHERARSRVAAFGNLPSVASGVASPSIAAWLLTSVAEEAPIWFAVAMTALSALFYGGMFRHWVPPEERTIGVAGEPGSRAAPPVRPTTAP